MYRNKINNDAKTGCLVLETGQVFEGLSHIRSSRAGEVVFNTAHSGYEEMATDPSYYSQILVMTAPMQGNYGTSRMTWESAQVWIEGFVCLELQNTPANHQWLDRLAEFKVPVLSQVDTRDLVLSLRQHGTVWGAIVDESDPVSAQKKAQSLIQEARGQHPDWVARVCRPEVEYRMGRNSQGPRVAVLDFGSKENILRSLTGFSSELAIFPSRANALEIKDWRPDGIVLTNGPGNPADVRQAVDTVRSLLGWRPMMGICMGHQILCQALGARTFKLKFGHHGANHPVKDYVLDKVYVTSQNHCYAVDEKSVPDHVRVTHRNLNDGTVEGIESNELACFSIQFHPESHPGPRDAEVLFDYFSRRL